MSNSRPHLSIDNWLGKLDLTVYRNLFKEYSGVEEILWMSERELKNLGINNGSHRARLSTSLTILKDKYQKVYKGNPIHLNADGKNLNVEKAHKTFTSVSPVNRLSIEKSHSGVRSWPTSEPTSTQNTRHSSPRSLGCYGGTEATVEQLKKALEKELSLDSSDLRSYAWYHGTILRQRAEELVNNDGDFLVRDCISKPGDFVITCKWNSVPLHLIIRKVILQPDTVYERIQYCFEKDSFDSIPGFITYYVGSKCPLSETIGAVISHPINRTMPLSYYASRYSSQCLVHYAAKAFEKVPSSSLQNENSLNHNRISKMYDKPEEHMPSKQENETENATSASHNGVTKFMCQWPNLTRVGSDPMLSPNTERRKLEHRPNSGTFSSEVIKETYSKSEDKPPPKPSRVPSKRCAQRPFVYKKEQKESMKKDNENIPPNSLPIHIVSSTHCAFKRQISETRFSFLDRPSLSDDGPSTTPEETMPFTIPEIEPPSVFNPQMFRTPLLNEGNAPLERAVLSRIKHMLLSTSSKLLACHMTRMDLEITKSVQDYDLGLGVTSGLELFLLPQGEQLRKDLLERAESMKLFVAISILTTPEEEERIKLLSKWIEIATETKTGLGNFYSFSSIMLGLTMPEIAELQSTWLALRHYHTEIAFAFETKLRPVFKALQNASGLEAPNTCIPYILSLILILQNHGAIMNMIEREPFNSEAISDSILNFSLPGGYSANDFGLQLLADHLEIGRNIMQQCSIFKTNGDISLSSIKYDNILLDMFNTEFHLRMLWGYRGSSVHSEERHQKFQKVLYLLYNTCNTDCG